MSTNLRPSSSDPVQPPQPDPAPPPQPDPAQSPWPGDYYGPGGSYGPGDPGGAGLGGGPDRPRRRRLLLVAAIVVAVGIGAFFGLKPAGSLVGLSPVLTTAQIAAKVDPGIVDVNSTLGYSQAASAGTGIVLTSSGEVLTNNHVIAGATSITVTDIGNGRKYRAMVVGYDRSHDIAVLQLAGASGLVTAPLGNSANAAVGQKVVTLGNALGKGGAPALATGQITGLSESVSASNSGDGTTEQLTGLIAHNANIQPGDSGGPLVSTAGEVIGIDTAASAHQAQSGKLVTGAVAIPINDALAIARQIESGKASATVHLGPTAFLGLQISSAERAAISGVQGGAGALVAGVVTGTPAGRAGLASGDVITKLGGQHIGSPSDLQAAMLRHHPGDRVAITWTDVYGQSQSATLVLAAGPAA